jgi:hypothetical protein
MASIYSISVFYSCSVFYSWGSVSAFPFDPETPEGLAEVVYQIAFGHKEIINK